jgi:hypothetical protein
MRISSIMIVGLALATGACVYTPPPPPALPPASAVSVPSSSASSSNCREFSDTITVGGQPQQAHGVACQQADGTWRIVDQAPPSTQGGVATTQTVPGYYPAYPYPYPYSYPSYPYYYGPPVAVGLGFGFGFGRRCFHCF